MVFRLRPRPKPRPVKTKKPTEFSIRESGTSLGELVPTQTPSSKTTDLPVPKTGLADTPEGKEAVKKILTGPEMGRRTFNKGLMGVLQQLFFPTPMPKLSKTKAPIPKATSLNIEWQEIRPMLREMTMSKFFGEDDDALEFQENLDEEAYINYAEQGGNPWNDMGTRDYEYYVETERDLVQDQLINNIMRWKMRENPEQIVKLINAWEKAEDIRTAPDKIHYPKPKKLLDEAEKAEKEQRRIVNFLMSGFEKYRDREKYNEEWFKKTAKNLERIPNSPPPFKTAHEMFIHNSKADARADQIPDNPSPSEIEQTTFWGDMDYWGTLAPDEREVTGWRSLVDSRQPSADRPTVPDLPVYSRRSQEGQKELDKSVTIPDQPVTRKIIDDEYETAITKLQHTQSDMRKAKINYGKEAHKAIDKHWYADPYWSQQELNPMESKQFLEEGDVEVQTTPDPVTGTIDKKITEFQKETEFQDRQAQEAKTVKDVKDKFLSRRQLLFPRKKNTGGLVGLY